MGSSQSKNSSAQVFKYSKSQLRLLEAEQVKAPEAQDEPSPLQTEFYDLPPVKELRIKITRLILLDKGDFGPAEASLLAKMLVFHYYSTPNRTLATKAFQRELQLIRIHGEQTQKEAVRLIGTLNEEEIERYAEISYARDLVN